MHSSTSPWHECDQMSNYRLRDVKPNLLDYLALPRLWRSVKSRFSIGCRTVSGLTRAVYDLHLVFRSSVWGRLRTERRCPAEMSVHHLVIGIDLGFDHLVHVALGTERAIQYDKSIPALTVHSTPNYHTPAVALVLFSNAPAFDATFWPVRVRVRKLYLKSVQKQIKTSQIILVLPSESIGNIL